MDRTFGEIITFYSYKGGTGRSMSLANIGYILSSDETDNSGPVLMIDWDLEAPGLEKFFREELTENFGADYQQFVDHAPGLIDYLYLVRDHYQRLHPSGDLPENTAHTPQAISVFQEISREVPFENFVIPLNEQRLSLMTAGARILGRSTSSSAGGGDLSSYADRVRRFDWQDFHKKYGSFFTHFRELLMLQYRVVLIDSRTGLTDAGGICTRVMPEKLVGVFIPNEQNIEGVKDVFARATRHRQNSRDPRGLATFPLASRIDASASRLRQIWWKGGIIDDREITGYEREFEDLFVESYDLDRCNLQEYFDNTQVPYDSDYAYGEKVAARAGTSDKLSIGFASKNLAMRLMNSSAPWEDDDAAVSSTFVPGKEGSIPGWKREFTSAIVAAAGLFIAFAGSLAWHAWMPGKAIEARIDNPALTITATSNTLAGLGFGNIDITASLDPEEISTGQSWEILFRTDQGSFDPPYLLLQDGGRGQTTFYSEGRGDARVQVSASGNAYRSNAATLDFQFTWPVEALAALLGGALAGYALRRRRNLLVSKSIALLLNIGLGIGSGLIYCLAMIAMFSEGGAPLHPAIIFAVAAVAPASFLPQIERITRVTRVQRY